MATKRNRSAGRAGVYWTLVMEGIGKKSRNSLKYLLLKKINNIYNKRPEI